MSRMAKGNTLSLEMSQKAQIEDLVKRNRNLETGQKQLIADIEAEKERSRQQLVQAQTKYQAEQAQWRKGVSTLHTCHYLSSLRIQLEGDSERLNVMREQDGARQERIARIQRDFRLVEFQTKESELQDQIYLLEDEVDALKAGISKRTEKFKRASADSLATVQDLSRQLALKEKQNEDLTRKLAAQIEETAREKADHESLLSKLERANLINDDAVTKQTELKREVEDLRKAKSDQDRQLDKWRSLETKGGEDMERERKRRIELEAEVEAMHSHYEQLKTKYSEKNVKYKKSLTDWEAHVSAQDADLDTANEAAENARQETDDLRRKYDKLRLELEKLKSLSPEKQSRAASPVAGSSRIPNPPLPKSRRATKSIQPEPQDFDSDTVEESTPRTAKAKPSRKAAKPMDAEPEEEEERENVDDIPTTKPKAKSRKKAAQSPPDAKDLERDNDAVEDVPAPKAKRQRKPKAAVDSAVHEIEEAPKVTGKGKKKAEVQDEEMEDAEDDDSVNEVEEVVKPKASQKKPDSDAKGKRKAKPREGSVVEVSEIIPRSRKRGIEEVQQDDEIEEVPPEVATGSRKRAASKPPSASTARPKPPSRQSQKPPSKRAEDGEPAKKTRRLNLFSTTAKPFKFNPEGGASVLLGIPTDLSPVKESDRAPPRSLSTLGKR